MALTPGARIVITIVIAIAVVSAAAMAAVVVLVTRGPDVPDESVLWLRLPAELAERQPDDLLSQLGGPRATVSSVVGALRKAAADDRIRTVVLAPSPQPAPWATAQEIRGAVEAFRASGKRIVAYLELGSSQAYYLASACDEVYLAPTSPLDLVGVSIYELFARNALDKIGVYPDMLHAGDFKTAANIYTETTFTPAHREMDESLARDFYDQLVIGVARGRGLPAADVRALIDEGPFLGDAARARGGTDGLLYEDELLERVAESDEPAERLSLADYRRVDPASLGLGGGPSIAVVYVVGAIVHGDGGGLDGTAGAATLMNSLRAAREDDDIEAIIVRINSPGGGAIASDLIWREIALAGEEKPVVASMSDLAASGGYYVAMPADVIVAQPGTLTGSIGVVGGKLALGGAFEKLGVSIEAVSAGRMAEMNSIATPYSDEARVRVQQQIDAIYEEFLARAAEGRGMTRDAVHAVAQGRVWTGRQARDIGLVDELGGMDAAVSAAKRLAGIDAGREVTLVPYPRPRTFFEVLNDGFTIRAGILNALRPVSPAAAAVDAAAAPLRLFRPGEPLALMPQVYIR
ncbi:MAG: signal peptide peptidase SppA [Acidobacteria bacterium]|nr:signal peptide peptidase SppA [Acidobacteriota bacterium]